MSAIKYPIVIGCLALQGVTVDEICAILGIKRRTFHNKVNGKTDFTLKEACIIAEKAKKTLDEIFLTNSVS